MSDPSSLRSRFNGAIPYLTKMAHLSSPFITTFMIIHMAAPMMANVGGSSLASQTMLLGREYYQTPFGEKYLVLAPLAIHTTSALLKRILKPPRRLTSLFTMTGYAAMLFFFPIHFATHRLLPTLPHPPILEVGPSELDFEFVKFGLQTWPWRSAFFYGGLVLCAGVHIVGGTGMLWNTYLGPTWGTVKQTTMKLRLGTMILGIIVPVLTGLAVVAAEPPMIFPSMSKRFEAVFMWSPVYRL